MTDRDEHCRVCGQTREWHMIHRPYHVFTNDSTRISLPGPPPQQRPMLVGDMVLRLTLLKKGIVTDFELAETKLWFERAAEMGQVVILEPDGENGGFKFRLATPDQLAQELFNGQTDQQTQEEAAEIPVRSAGKSQVPGT